MIGSDVAAATTFVGIAFAHSLPLLVVLAGLSALAESPFGAASQALLVMLVPEDKLNLATATRSSSASAGMLLGGALGGFLVAALGGTTSFLLNAASFVISAALVSRIKAPTARRLPPTGPIEECRRASASCCRIPLFA